MLYYKVGVDFDRVGDVICHNTKKGNIEIIKYCRAQEEEPMDKDFELLFDKKEGNVLTDLLANDNGWFLVSERFREIILEQFNTNVQFFDVKIKEVQSRSILEKYYIANILSTVDALCLEGSEYSAFNIPNSNHQVYSVRKYCLYENALNGLDLFKLTREHVNCVFCSEKVKKMCEERNITGMSFSVVRQC